MNRLRKKLKDSIESFNNHLQQISSEYREIVQRRYFTVTGKNPDDKTVDLLISTGHLLFQTLFEFSVEIFRRFHWEFSKGFMCVVWLGFLFLFLFFFGFLLVLKEIIIIIFVIFVGVFLVWSLINLTLGRQETRWSTRPRL